MDLVTDLPLSRHGNDSIVVFVCMFSKMIRCIPIVKAINAEEMARIFILEIYSKFGLPEAIISDRDVRMTGNFWPSFFRVLGTRLSMSSAFHPQTDGQTERMNRSLEEMLRAYVGPRQDDWDDLLPLMEFAYNNKEHTATGFTPFYLNLGRHPHTSLTRSLQVESDVPSVEDYIKRMREAQEFAYDNLNKAQETMKRRADDHRKPVTFSVGDEVLLSVKNVKIPAHLTKKFSALYIGPYKVVKVLNEVAVVLDLPPELGKMERTFHVGLLKHYYPDEFNTSSKPPPVEVEGELEWELDAIIDKKRRGRNKVLHYLVAWKGYPRSEAKWRPVHELEEDGVMHFVEDYEKAQAINREAHDINKEVVRSRKTNTKKVRRG